MLTWHQINVTTTGSAGSATGSGSVNVPSGRLIAVYLDYTSQPVTTDVTVTTAFGAVSQTMLTVSNSATDAWYYPRALMQGNTGSNLTAWYEPYPVDGSVTVTVAQGDAATNGVVATIVVERD